MFKRLLTITALVVASAVYSDAQEASGWFAGGGAGVNIGADGLRGKHPSFSVGLPAVQAYGGKWVDDLFGIRFGIQGLHAAGFYGNEGFNFLAMPVDLLFDAPNFFFDWTRDNILGLYPYISMMPAFGIPSGYTQFGAGAGAIGTLRLQGPWSLYADVRGSIIGQNITGRKNMGIFGLGSITAGLQYNFSKEEKKPAFDDTNVLATIAAQGLEEPTADSRVQLGNYSGGLKGTVISRSTRAGIRGADIKVYSGAAELTGVVTDGAGGFAVSGLPDGRYSLVINAPDCLENRVEVTVNDGYVKNMFNISMTSVQHVAEIDEDSFMLFDTERSGYDDNPVILFGSNDVFNNLAGYNFSSVRFRPRGYTSESQDVYFAGVKMNDAVTGYSPFSLWSGLNEATRAKDSVSGGEVSDFGLGGYNGLTNIFANARSVRKGLRGSVLTNSALYRLRLMGSYATGLMDNGWAYAVNVSARLGGNDWIDGVYYRSFAYYLAADKVLDDRHKFGFIFFATPGERGAQNASTQEVYDLMGDNMYNSNWGYQNGKVRNARVRRTNEPVAVVKYDFTPETDWALSATVLYRFGKNGYTALDWYDAQDPRPDYYRNLPSYFYSPITDLNRDNSYKEGWSREVWTYHRNYPSITHINWDRFYDVNRAQADGKGLNRSKYVQEERHVDQNDLNFSLTFKNWQNRYMTVNGGLTARINRTEYYKQLADLLGGDYFLDIDNFAERDFAASPGKLQNDVDYFLRHGQAPVIQVGDKYGYDYYAQIRNYGAWINGKYTIGNFSASLGGRIGYDSFWREGLVRKGLFPGQPSSAAEASKWTAAGIVPTDETSFGKSDVCNFITYAGKLGLNYVIGGTQRVYANLGYFNDAPHFNQAFLSPRTRNTVMDNLKTVKTLASDVNWQYSGNGINVRATAFYATIKDQSKVMSAYDDLQNTFSNFAVNGIDQRNMGVEFGFKMPTYVVPNLSVQGVLSAGSYVYTSNPTMTQTVDNSAEIVMENEPVPYWKSTVLSDGTTTQHYVPTTPQLAASIGLAYNRNYWFVDADVEYFAESYLDMNPLYRTASAVAGPDNVTTDAEIAYLTAQEKFDPAMLVNLSVGKSWFIRYKYQLGFSLNVRNMLNNKNVKTGGYEQTRLVDNTLSKSQYYRFDPKYFYMAGTNYMLNVYFRF
jgi:hypothetical protein